MGVVTGGLSIGVFGIRTIPSTYGGYETFCTVMLPELVKRGHSVTLYARERPGGKRSYEGVTKVGLPSIPTKQLDTLSHSFVAASAARLKRHDVVLCFNVANAPALNILTKTGTPTVLNVDGQEWIRGNWGNVAKKVFYNCAKLAKRSATKLISDCEAMATVYRNEFESESTVIPYCWTGLIEEDHRLPADDAFLEAVGLKNRSYFVTGGRLIPENHISEITRSHLDTDLDFPIAVLGAAVYGSSVLEELEDLAKSDDRVRLLGHISDRRGFGVLLRDARVYFHGHSVGGINPSIVEAMGVGALIAAYDTPFNREATGPVGHYFANPRIAVSEILPLLETDDADRRQSGIERVQERFSLKQIVDLYDQVLRDAAGS
jgi:glycosyltransferase involved in cell wall biosynthesis